MGLLDQYNNLDKETQDSLGKTGTKINTAGAHLVTIESMQSIEDKRVKIVFKDASGLTAEYVGFTSNNDATKAEAAIKRTMSQLTNIVKATGNDLKTVLGKEQAGTETYKSGKTVDVVNYPAAKGKKLYIITYSEISADEKDASKTWVRQEIDVFNFFDTKKRNGMEINSDAAEGTTMETVAEDAKARVEINYKNTNSAACQAKLQAMLSGVTPAGQNAPTSVPASDDDI